VERRGTALASGTYAGGLASYEEVDLLPQGIPIHGARAWATLYLSAAAVACYRPSGVGLGSPVNPNSRGEGSKPVTVPS
jgi:hypothetical protein